MGSTFGGGGGSHTLFGATGVENVLTKSTKTVVVFFAITCILLTRLSSQNRESVLDTEGHRPTQPIQQEQNTKQSTDPASDQTDETTQSDKKSTQVKTIPAITSSVKTVPAEAVPVETAPVETAPSQAEDVEK